jgi:hypothetical protein
VSRPKALLLFSNDFTVPFQVAFIFKFPCPVEPYGACGPLFLLSIEQYVPYFGNIYSQPKVSATVAGRCADRILLLPGAAPGQEEREEQAEGQYFAYVPGENRHLVSGGYLAPNVREYFICRTYMT